MNQYNLSLTKSILIYVVVSLFLVFEMAVQVSPSVMAPNLMHDLSLGAFALGVMSSVYFYTYTSMQIPSGLLFDRVKPKKIIISSILVCSLGAALFGLSPNVYFGCFARLFMGLGSAFAFVSVLVVAADLFPPKYFAFLAGITQMLAAMGAMVGQMPVGLLVNTLGWRGTMFFLSAVGAMLAITVWSLMNYDKLESNVKCKFSCTPKVSVSLKVILSHPQTWFIALYACLLWAPMSGFASLWGVSFLVKAYGLSNESAAFYSSLMWLGLAISSPLLGAVSTGNKKIPLLVSALIGFLAFFFILETSLSHTMLAVCLLLAGGACAGQAISFALVRDNNPSNIRATAIAINNMAVVISGAIVQPLMGKLISYHATNHALI